VEQLVYYRLNVKMCVILGRLHIVCALLVLSQHCHAKALYQGSKLLAVLLMPVPMPMVVVMVMIVVMIVVMIMIMVMPMVIRMAMMPTSASLNS
jgi:hypothetical protein